MKNNREEFEYIAQDATSFLNKINQTCLRVQEKRGELPEDLLYDLGEFVTFVKLPSLNAIFLLTDRQYSEETQGLR